MTATIRPVFPAYPIVTGGTDGKILGVGAGGQLVELDGAVGGTSPWIVVTDDAYGAVGDGVEADESVAIQAALDAAEAAVAGDGVPRTVYIPAGTYLLQTRLSIPSNVTLILDPAARLKKNASGIGRLICNKTTGGGGYTGAENITVIGGILDGNLADFPTDTVVLASFGHIRGITLRGIHMTGVHELHHVEFNSTQRGVIVDCICEDFDVGSRDSECIQLDLAKSSSHFFFGPYDDTPCDDILIQGCTFRDGVSRAIGSHSFTAGVYHTNVRILGNHIAEADIEAIKLLNYRDTVVAGNTIQGGTVGVQMDTCSRVLVTGNAMTDQTTACVAIASDCDNNTVRANQLTPNGGSKLTTAGTRTDTDLPFIFDAGNSGTALTIDWRNGPQQKVTLTGDATITSSNPETGGIYQLILVQDGTGGRAVTLTGWDFGDDTPEYTTTTAAKNVVTATYDGAEYIAAHAVAGA